MMPNYLDVKPTDCRLTDCEWRTYREAAQRGNLFFNYGTGPFALFNRWWQTRRRATPFRQTPSHVGVVGANRGAYESVVGRGPTRDFSVDRYLLSTGGRLEIGEFTTGFDDRDVDRAFSALHHYMERLPRYWFLPKYDYLSLLTYGAFQLNGAVICSEIVAYYSNELLRNSSGYMLSVDELVLPVDWLRKVTVIWEG